MYYLTEDTTTLRNSENDGQIDRDSLYILIALFAVLPFVGVLPQIVTSMAAVLLCLLLMLNGDLYLAMPIMIFYYFPFGSLFGMSVYRIYTFMYAFYLVYKKLITGDRTVDIKIIPFLIYLVFCTFALAVNDLRTGIFAFFDVIIVFAFVEEELSDTERLKRFFTVWAVVSLFAFFTGYIADFAHQEQQIFNGKLVILSRNAATFEDPNYMGFFFTISIFSLAILKPFKRAINTVLIIILYFMLLSSLSITAVIANILLWCIYFLLSGNKRLGMILIGLAICAAAFALYARLSESGDTTSFLGQLALRINEKINALLSGDMNSFATNRTSLTKSHIDLFLQQPLWRQLIGLNPVCPAYRDETVFSTVAHNEYVDWLHNIGIIGTLGMLTFLALSLYNAYADYTEENIDINLFLVMLKCIWALYAFTLTLFMDPKFMIPFLL